MISKEQLDNLVRKYHDKGYNPAHIGTVLRDLHLINLKQELSQHYEGKKLCQVYSFLNKNYQLEVYKKRNIILKTHLSAGKNKKDHRAKRALVKILATIIRLAK